MNYYYVYYFSAEHRVYVFDSTCTTQEASEDRCIVLEQSYPQAIWIKNKSLINSF